MSSTFELIKLLRQAPIIYGAYELNEKISVDMIKYIKFNYKNLITSTILKTLTEFGDELLNYDASANYEDPELEFIETEYINRFINLPIFWQEIVVLLYMSLHLQRVVQPDSIVVSLGESPLKLVFIEEVLNTSSKFKHILEQNHIATDVEYSYFPASKLSYYVVPKLFIDNDIFNVKIEFNVDDFIMNGIKHITDGVNDKVLEHFRLFNLDPLSILIKNKNIYFQDRAESYKTLLTFICFYEGMCRIQNLDIKDRINFYNKLYIIGFDVKYKVMDDPDTIIIDRLNQFLYRIITTQKDNITPDRYHFIKKNFYMVKTEIKNCLYPDFNLFTNQDNVMHKLIVFLTTPEKTFNNSRCIKSCPINNFNSNCTDEINEAYTKTYGKFYIKETGTDGYNCNLINLCFMIFINEIEPHYLDNLIKNLDTLDLDRLYKNSMNFDGLNSELSEYISSLRFNNNVLNNLLNNKLIINKINKMIERFFETNGLFVPCNYSLPI